MERINEFTLAKENGNLYTENQKLITENIVLKRQIEKMKSDVIGNLRFAEHSNNEIMRQKMCSMLLQWESRYK